MTHKTTARRGRRRTGVPGKSVRLQLPSRARGKGVIRATQLSGGRKPAATVQPLMPVDAAAQEAERHGVIEDAEMLPAARDTIDDHEQIDWVEAADGEGGDIPMPDPGVRTGERP